MENIQNRENAGAYDKIYVGDIVSKQGRLFLNMREAFPGIDEKWFISEFMKSNVRKMLDFGIPKYAGMSGIEWAHELFYELGPSKPEEGIFIESDYRRGEEWGGFLPQWVGIIYALYQWKYNIPSREIIDILPLDFMERAFPVLHQAGSEVAVEKIYEDINSANSVSENTDENPPNISR